LIDFGKKIDRLSAVPHGIAISMGVPPERSGEGGSIGYHPSPPLIHNKMSVRKIWPKNFYITPMKTLRYLLGMKKREAVRFDLAMLAACVIVAAVIMGLYNLLS